MRHIYIDAGANWCNTLDLYKKVPEYRSNDAWQIYAFEATPIISAYLELCTDALTKGRALPPSPLPPTGSSVDLFNYALRFGCDAQSWVKCIRKTISEKRPLVSNLTTSEVERRLHYARHHVQQTAYTAIPRAVSTSSEGVVLYGANNLWQLVRGGALAENAGTRSSHLKATRVASVNLVKWMKDSFQPEDFVVLKMDIEGAEQQIIPQMLRQGAVKLVDVLLWECHYNANHHISNFTKCHKLESNLLKAGLARIHREPYRFLEQSYK